MTLAMERIKAQELLEQPEYIDRLTMDSYYLLLVRAGHNKDKAKELMKKRSWDRMIRGMHI